MKRSSVLLTTSLLAGAVLAGCGGTATAPEDGTPAAPPASTSPPVAAPEPGQAPAASTVITIRDFSYTTPQQVPPGAQITIRNEDRVAHTVTADQGEVFDVEVPPSGEVTFTAPEQAGSYPFFCAFHANMTGTLSVG